VKELAGEQYSLEPSYFTKKRIKIIYRLGFDSTLVGFNGKVTKTDYDECLQQLVDGFPGRVMSEVDPDGQTSNHDGRISPRIIIECALYRTYSHILERSLTQPAFAPLLGDRHWYLTDLLKPPAWWWTGFWQKYGTYLTHDKNSPLKRKGILPEDYIPIVFSDDFFPSFGSD